MSFIARAYPGPHRWNSSVGHPSRPIDWRLVAYGSPWGDRRLPGALNAAKPCVTVETGIILELRRVGMLHVNASAVIRITLAMRARSAWSDGPA